MLVDPVVEPPRYERKEWLSVLAKAHADEVTSAWNALDERPDYQALRAPEVGLVLVRGRMGGLGDAFNVGEMTLTRAAVRLQSGETGLAYVAGCDRRHAEIAAAVDAMMQSPELRGRVEGPVVARLDRAQRERRTLVARKAAATKVDFFTMVTGRGGA
ncbi:MAG: phosphonate C-P lyase system protein PhnG [Caulobacteraceae bacterium]